MGLVNTFLAWLWILILQKIQTWGETARSSDQDEKIKKVILQKKNALGKMSMHEWQVLILFIILVILWFFKTPVFIPGWGDLFKRQTMRDPPTKVSVSSATPAVLIVFGASTMKTADMMKAGVIMNVICVLTTWGAINTYGVPMFGLSEFPAWADLTGETNCLASNNTSLPSPLAVN